MNALPRAILAGLTALAACGAGSAVRAQPAPPPCIDPGKPGPWFRLIRYDEHFCDRPDQPSDPAWFRLKNLGEGDARWSFGGEVRARVESYDPVFAGLRQGRDDTYLMYRGLVHGEVRFADHWRVFGQAGYWNSQGREPRPSPTDVDRGEISQFFIERSTPGGSLIRAGRQEAMLGSGRLIGIRHAPNIRIAFDGVRIANPIGQSRWEIFHLRPVTVEPGAFDNRENSRERVFGVQFSRAQVIQSLALEAYAFRFERPFQRFATASGEDRRNVYGARVFGAWGKFTVNHELTIQRGSVGALDARAWAYHTDTQWRQTPASPWFLGLKTVRASGDDNPNDGRIESYQPIYAAPPAYMQSSLVYPSNLQSLHPYVEWAVSPRWTIGAEIQANWRLEEEDGYYQPPLVPTALDADGTFIATQIGVSTRVIPRRDITIEAWASRFEPKGPLRRAGAKPTTFLALMTTWSF